MVWLTRTYYSLLNLQAKFFKIVSFGQIYSELRKIRSIRPKYPAPFINTLCFRYLPRQEILSNSSKLHKFHAVCPHSPRITRNSHHCQLIIYYVSRTCPGREPSGIPANYANSMHFTHIVHELHEIHTIVNLSYIMFQTPTSGRELPKIPANQAKFDQFAHIPHELCEFHTFHTNSSYLAHQFQISDH